MAKVDPNITHIEVDCSTGEKYIYLDTDEKATQREADAAAYAAQKVLDDAEAVVQADAKTALLAKLGITADEARLLLGGN